MKLKDAKERLEVHHADLSGSSFDDINMSGWCVDKVNLSGLRLTHANLAGASIKDCRLEGLTIDGILVTELLAAYRASKTSEG